ncbi:hypothetical protein HYPSUDRAFT_733044 [Hypholoma sublateritium FD-334 SS-4]|uniref:Uncharacterized protein n=1 Tax=Hypholoma sublateritium (strain FD-334 SS-4) TaxID=945553 RepID=A0A0D2NY74_HYPSF|nr:hypothetical protein HYPSUDRAFT_733044 [Hypholoma sublateritium FD-334 SS-4]
MFSRRTPLLPLLAAILTVIAAVAAHTDGASFRRHQRLHNRLNSARELSETSNFNRAIAGTTRVRKSCAASTSASSSATTSTSAKGTTTKPAATKTTHAQPQAGELAHGDAGRCGPRCDEDLRGGPVPVGSLQVIQQREQRALHRGAHRADDVLRPGPRRVWGHL